MLQIVYRDRDNAIDFRLKASTVNDPILKIVDLSDVTRMVLTRDDGLAVDSDKYPTVFDWSTLATSGIVVIKLGLVNLTPGKDMWRLIVYDSTNPNGINWGDDFYLDIKKEYVSNL